MCANERYFAIARAIAEKRTKVEKTGNYYFGAVGIRPDGLLVQSYNIYDKKRQAFEGHAEYRLASKLQAGSDVYVVRVNRQQTDRIGKPCPRCESRLRNQRVRNVYYTIGPNEYGVLSL